MSTSTPLPPFQVYFPFLAKYLEGPTLSLIKGEEGFPTMVSAWLFEEQILKKNSFSPLNEFDFK